MKINTHNKYKYMGTYGTPVLYDSKRTVMLHVDDGEEPKPKRWFEKFLEKITNVLDFFSKKIVNIFAVFFITHHEDGLNEPPQKINKSNNKPKDLYYT